MVLLLRRAGAGLKHSVRAERRALCEAGVPNNRSIGLAPVFVRLRAAFDVSRSPCLSTAAARTFAPAQPPRPQLDQILLAPSPKTSSWAHRRHCPTRAVLQPGRRPDCPFVRTASECQGNPHVVGRCNKSPVHRYGPGPYTYRTGLTMYLPFPQDLHDPSCTLPLASQSAEAML
jgi:hypothetical protein